MLTDEVPTAPTQYATSAVAARLQLVPLTQSSTSRTSVRTPSDQTTVRLMRLPNEKSVRILPGPIPRAHRRARAPLLFIH